MQSPRVISSSEGGRVAVNSTYDGRRLVSSPTSLQACRIEGVLPEMLLLRDLQRGKLDRDDDPYSACLCSTPEQVQLKKDFIERKRKALVAAVFATREKLLAARRSGDKLPTIGHENGAATVADESYAAATSSPRRADTSTVPGSPRSAAASTPRRAPGNFHNVAIPADNTEVAQYYEQLKQQADEAARRHEQWEKKMKRVEEKARDASAKRAEIAAKSGAVIDQRVVAAQTRARRVQEEKLHHVQEALAKEESKIQSISAQRTVRHKQMKSRRPDHGATERAAADQQEQERVEALRDRLEKAQQSSAEAMQAAAKERERRAFFSELQNAAYKEQNLRTQRAQQNRTFELEARLADAAAKREKAAFERDQAHFQRSLQREVIQRQKHEVLQHVQTHGRTSPTLPAPGWLEPQLQALREKQRTASTARGGPRPPNSPRSEAGSTASPRSARASSYKVREPFTISSPDTPRKQVFAPWMFQNE